MNRTRIVKLFSEYIFSIPAALALAGSLCEFFLIPESRVNDIAALLLFSAAFLLLFHVVFFSRLTFKISLGVAILSVFTFYAVMHFAFHRMPVPGYSTLLRYLFPIVIFFSCLIIYFGSRYLWSVFLLLVGGSGLFFAMSFQKMGPKPELYYIYLISLTVLFIEKLACKRLSFMAPGELFRSCGHFLCIGLAIIVIAQFLYEETNIRFEKRTSAPEYRIVVSGFEDMDSMEHFGAPLVTNNDVALMVNSSADSFYLKGDTFENYDDSKWTRAAEKSRQPLNDFRSFFWMEAYTFVQNRGFFAGHSPTDHSAFLDYFRKNRTSIPIRSITVTHQKSNFENLFLPAGFFQLRTKGGFTAPSSENYSLKKPVPGGVPYTVFYPEPDMKSPEIQYLLKNGRSIEQSVLNDWRKKGSIPVNVSADKSFSAGAATYAQAADSFEKYDAAITKQCLQLGASVTGRTKELAVSLTKNCGSDDEKVQAVRQYLQKSNTYTLNPPQLPVGEDLVDYFLFGSRLGYCVHYATAMTILLRASGVPARFVCGFVSPDNQKGNTFRVTNGQAHAWVEVYSHTLGFYPVDATGSTVHNPSRVNQNSGKSSQAEKITGSVKQAVDYNGLFSAVKIVALLLCCLVAFIFIKKAMRFQGMKKLDANSQVIGYYQYYVAVLGKFGLKRTLDETFSEFSNQLKMEPQFHEKFGQATELYLRAAFSGAPVTSEDARRMADFRKTLLKFVRRYAGLPKYLLKFPWL